MCSRQFLSSTFFVTLFILGFLGIFFGSKFHLLGYYVSFMS